MGGIADYSGSLLLQMPIAELTTVQLQKGSGEIFRASTDTDEKQQSFEIDLRLLQGKNYQESGAMIRSLPGGNWASYILGCYLVLEKEKGLLFRGDNLTVSSHVPPGKGVSSSAAIEVAVMHAIQKAYGISMPPVELAVLAQKVENLVVGAACGLMDQLSVNLGKKDCLLPLICQPHEVMDPIPVPDEFCFMGIDSGVRHAIGGASYGDVRAAAFMAYSVFLIEMGIDPSRIAEARQSGQWEGLPFRGFLGNIPLHVFEKDFAGLIPERMSGESFIENYGYSIDPVTNIEPGKNYALRAAALHPVRENFRVGLFMKYIQEYAGSTNREMTLRAMGELMMDSHLGYTSLGLGESMTDEILKMLRLKGPAKGVYGGRISGGGSGGTVVILADKSKGVHTVKGIHQFMQDKTGKELYLFSGSSEGAHYLNT